VGRAGIGQAANPPRRRERVAEVGVRGDVAAGWGLVAGEEDDMSDTTPELDEAFERMAAASFELPNGFVNHGAMACEALASLGCTDDIDSWARRFAEAGGALVEPVAAAGFEWQNALGDYRRLAEWIGYFARAVDGDGWSAVVQTWVPRLMPGLRTALFHGAIRTAHAVRAIAAADTPPRQGEMARALGYWAARLGSTTSLRFGSSPTLTVVTSGSSSSARWMARRSNGCIASRVMGSPVTLTWRAARKAISRTVCSRRWR